MRNYPIIDRLCYKKNSGGYVTNLVTFKYDKILSHNQDN